MTEDEKNREQAAALLREIGDGLTATNHIVDAILTMKLCTDVDLLIELGVRAMKQLDQRRSDLTPPQYENLLKTILSVADTEETRISTTEYVITLH